MESIKWISKADQRELTSSLKQFILLNECENERIEETYDMDIQELFQWMSTYGKISSRYEVYLEKNHLVIENKRAGLVHKLLIKEVVPKIMKMLLGLYFAMNYCEEYRIGPPAIKKNITGKNYRKFPEPKD